MAAEEIENNTSSNSEPSSSSDDGNGTSSAKKLPQAFILELIASKDELTAEQAAYLKSHRDVINSKACELIKGVYTHYNDLTVAMNALNRLLIKLLAHYAKTPCADYIRAQDHALARILLAFLALANYKQNDSNPFEGKERVLYLQVKDVRDNRELMPLYTSFIAANQKTTVSFVLKEYVYKNFYSVRKEEGLSGEKLIKAVLLDCITLFSTFIYGLAVASEIKDKNGLFCAKNSPEINNEKEELIFVASQVKQVINCFSHEEVCAITSLHRKISAINIEESDLDKDSLYNMFSIFSRSIKEGNGPDLEKEHPNYLELIQDFLKKAWLNNAVITKEEFLLFYKLRLSPLSFAEQLRQRREARADRLQTFAKALEIPTINLIEMAPPTPVSGGAAASSSSAEAAGALMVKKQLYLYICLAKIGITGAMKEGVGDLLVSATDYTGLEDSEDTSESFLVVPKGKNVNKLIETTRKISLPPLYIKNKYGSEFGNDNSILSTWELLQTLGFLPKQLEYAKSFIKSSQSNSNIALAILENLIKRDLEYHQKIINHIISSLPNRLAALQELYKSSFIEEYTYQSQLRMILNDYFDLLYDVLSRERAMHQMKAARLKIKKLNHETSISGSMSRTMSESSSSLSKVFYSRKRGGSSSRERSSSETKAASSSRSSVRRSRVSSEIIILQDMNEQSEIKTLKRMLVSLKTMSENLSSETLIKEDLNMFWDELKRLNPMVNHLDAFFRSLQQQLIFASALTASPSSSTSNVYTAATGPQATAVRFEALSCAKLVAEEEFFRSNTKPVSVLSQLNGLMFKNAKALITQVQFQVENCRDAHASHEFADVYKEISCLERITKTAHYLYNSHPKVTGNSAKKPNCYDAEFAKEYLGKKPPVLLALCWDYYNEFRIACHRFESVVAVETSALLAEVVAKAQALHQEHSAELKTRVTELEKNLEEMLIQLLHLRDDIRGLEADLELKIQFSIYPIRESDIETYKSTKIISDKTEEALQDYYVHYYAKFLEICNTYYELKVIQRSIAKRITAESPRKNTSSTGMWQTPVSPAASSQDSSLSEAGIRQEADKPTPSQSISLAHSREE